MPHIDLPQGAYGITGLLTTYPASGRVLSELAQVVLRGPSSLTSAEREMIATRVSAENKCNFCAQSHAAAARHLLGPERGLVDDIVNTYDPTNLSPKMKALLYIAEKVRRDARLVTEGDVRAARSAGADEQAIHDTVLIAAMFCMYNRYVDGLATTVPPNRVVYDQMGAILAREGYVRPTVD